MTLIITAAAIVMLAIIGLIAYSRRPRQDDGVTSFRRHIDALSSESRRELKDRIEAATNDDPDTPQEPAD